MARLICGMICMSGANLAWLFTCSIDAQRSRRAARSKRLICASSAANDFTTRIPVTSSSTMVAMSAVRASITHEIGNSRFRMRAPTMYSGGSISIVTSVSLTSMLSIRISAAMKLNPATASMGPKPRNIWMARMSELAREISWPLCTVS